MFPREKGKSRRDQHYVVTSAPIAKGPGHWKDEGPHRRGMSEGKKKYDQPSRERYQPESIVQDLIGLARADAD